MNTVEIIKAQEARSRLTLTEKERSEAVAFFKERRAEKAIPDLLPSQINGNIQADNLKEDTLRHDIPSENADRNAFLTQFPDKDGAFLRVPRTLSSVQTLLPKSTEETS